MTLPRSPFALPCGLALACLAALALLAFERRPWAQLMGDESTYLAMAESLVHERDLAFGESDRRRAEEAAPRGRETLILQRSDRGVTYSKPILYAALAAPFVALAGPHGFFLLNALLLAAALALAWTLLRRLGPAPAALLTLVTFAGSGVLLPHIGWRMSDLLQAALVLAGLVAAIAPLRRRAVGHGGAVDRFLDGSGGVAAAGLAFGLVISMRYPHALLAVAAAGALATSGRWRRALAIGLVAAATFLGVSALQWRALGTANPYRAERATFRPEIGYPVGAGAGEAMLEFEERVKRSRISIWPEVEPAASGYATFYFLVGRHSGLLVYLPAALLLAWTALRRGDRVSWTLVAGAAGLAAFYLVWLPGNYFGGSSFLGNRYALSAYPALLAALPALPGRRSQLAVWGVTAAAVVSAAISIPRAEGFRSQSHAHAGLFRLLPYESVARSIEGREDHYWSDELVRFVDPYAQVGESAFRLQAGAPPAELLVAHPREHGVLRFLVRADAPRAELVYRDWGREQTYPLEPRPGTPSPRRAQGLVEIVPSAAWRRHAFPWRPRETWWGRVFRLSLRTPDGAPASAELRYLGPYRPAHKFYRHVLMAGELPAAGVAGSVTRVRLRLRNTGLRHWTSDGVAPVEIGYRFERDGARARVGRPQPVPGRVTRAQEVDVAFDLRWPERPGSYRLTVDLLLGRSLWFAELGGEPLAARRVEVTAPADERVLF